jgi:hypothetical protein
MSRESRHHGCRRLFRCGVRGRKSCYHGGPDTEDGESGLSPLKPRVERFSSASFLSLACPLSSEFFCIHIAAAACISSLPETLPS